MSTEHLGFLFVEWDCVHAIQHITWNLDEVLSPHVGKVLEIWIKKSWKKKLYLECLKMKIILCNNRWSTNINFSPQCHPMYSLNLLQHASIIPSLELDLKFGAVSKSPSPKPNTYKGVYKVYRLFVMLLWFYNILNS